MIEPAYAWRVGRDDKDARNKAISRSEWTTAVADRWLSKSPILGVNRQAMERYLEYCRSGDPAGFAARIDALAWLPMTRDVRDRGLRNWINKGFGGWRNWVQGSQQRARPLA